MSKYIFTYQTVCKINGKSYIGVHGTNDVNDGYIGCGIYSQGGATKNSPFHHAVRKYGYENFYRNILDYFDSYEEALREERILVDKEWVSSDANYNCALGGKGSPWAGMSDERKNDFKNKITGSGNHRYGKRAKNIRKVLQYSIDCKLVMRFDSISDAAKAINNQSTNVAKCCIGKYSVCGGYIFRYAEYSEEEKKILGLNLSKRKRIYNQNGSYEMSEDVRIMLSDHLKKVKPKKHSEASKEKMRIAKYGNNNRIKNINKGGVK